MAEKLTPMLPQFFEVKPQIGLPMFGELFAGVQSRGKGSSSVRRCSPRNAET
jgi:hypothetical protein